MFRLVLALLDWALTNVLSDEDALALWRVLTALRGDDGNHVAKSASTNHIRMAALPQFFGSGKAGRMKGPEGYGSGIKSVTKTDCVTLPAGSKDHFVRHARLAAQALGLTIKEV